MGKRHGWIAVALVSLVGGKALAQQTYEPNAPQDQPGPQQAEPGTQGSPAQPPMEEEQGMDAAQPQQPEQVQPMQQPQQPPAAEPSATGDASKSAQPSSRLSQIQGDGVRLSQLDQQQITELQRALQEAGYYTAEVDGIVGPQTRRALRQFYSDQAQLAAQGMILPQGAAALGLDEAEIERVRGEDQGQADQPVRTPGTTGDTGAADDTTDVPQQRPPSSPTPSPGAPDPEPPTSPHMHDDGTMMP